MNIKKQGAWGLCCLPLVSKYLENKPGLWMHTLGWLLFEILLVDQNEIPRLNHVWIIFGDGLCFENGVDCWFDLGGGVYFQGRPETLIILWTMLPPGRRDWSPGAAWRARYGAGSDGDGNGCRRRRPQRHGARDGEAISTYEGNGRGRRRTPTPSLSDLSQPPLPLPKIMINPLSYTLLSGSKLRGGTGGELQKGWMMTSSLDKKKHHHSAKKNGEERGNGRLEDTFSKMGEKHQIRGDFKKATASRVRKSRLQWSTITNDAVLETRPWK